MFGHRFDSGRLHLTTPRLREAGLTGLKLREAGLTALKLRETGLIKGFKPGLKRFFLLCGMCMLLKAE